MEIQEEYTLLGFGTYTPFIGDPDKPFSTDPKYLNSSFSDSSDFIPHGNYKVRAIMTTEQGKTITAENEEYLFTDNTAPEFKLSLPHGVYEYEAGQKTVPVSGSIYEKNINDMMAAGFNISQAANKVMYYYNKPKPGPTDMALKPNSNISINPDGTFASEIPMDESIPILPVRFYSHSVSTAGNYPKMPTTYFIKKRYTICGGYTE